LRLAIRQACHRASLILLVAASTAAAQDGSPASEPQQADPAAPAVAAEQGSETVVVTGSRIRGIAPVGAPTIALGRAEIGASTASNVADFLKEIPQVVATGIDETSFTTSVAASNVSRATAINLRGLGPVATLVLLDGHRVTQSGTAGAFVDTSVIPTIAIQRVEVVADGASAIYGSDAVAGVVNMIVRRDFAGAESAVRVNVADGYQRHQFSQLFGHHWDSGNAMFAYEYTGNDSLNSSERRNFYRQDQRARGGSDFRQSTCYPGNIIVNDVSYALPQSSSGQPIDPASLVPNTRNLCDNAITDLIPEQKRHSAIFSVRQDLTDRIRFNAGGYYSRKTFEPEFAAQGSVTSLATLTVPNTNAFYVLPAGVNANRVVVERSFVDEAGLRSADGVSETYSGTADLEIDLAGDWRMQIAGSWGQNYDRTFSRTIYSPALTAALASSDPATALNPFGPGTNPEVIDGIFVGQFTPEGRNTMAAAEVRADGALLDLPGGSMRLAVGSEYRRNSLSTVTSRGTVDVPLSDIGYNEREVMSGYAEVFVPIVGTPNARPGIRRLSLSMAARYDDYSDFGSTSNPKVGITWEPLESLELRGSYGTSFRAPGLSDLRPPGQANVSSTAIDPLSPTGRSRGITIRAGNPDLGPEEATTYTLGAKWTPLALPDLSVDVTYFSIDYENQIATPFGASPLQQEDIYADVITRNPTPEQVQAVLNNGLPLSGVLPPVIEYIIDSRPMNRGVTDARGFDLQTRYQWHFDRIGSLSWRTTGTYFTKYDTQLTPSAPVLERVNTIDYPLRFRARSDLNWALSDLSAGLAVNYSSGYKDTSFTPNRDIDSYVTLDFNSSYQFGGNSSLAGLTLSLNVANVLDEDPPFVNQVSGYDGGKASPYGRLFSIGITKSW
jgi:iron complex outermembrane receptor protein